MSATTTKNSQSSEKGRSGYLGSQVNTRLDVERYSTAPPLPKKIGIEINNSCNHKCYFCQNPTMTRPRRVMDGQMVRRVLREAHDAGIRHASFYSGGEPFLNRDLPGYVYEAKKLGFEYVYLSTNGGKVVSDRLIPVLNAGVDSVKFSINAGDRETYSIVHGHDEFEHVMRNLEFVARHRAETGSPKRLFVSCVETPINRSSIEALKARVGPIVDEVVIYPFVVIGTPLKKRIERDGTERPFIGYEDTDKLDEWNRKRLKLPCYQLWSYLNVTVEGYLSACCSDYNNDLVVGNLHNSSLLEAWSSPEFQELRLRHLNGNIDGTLCEGCILQKDRTYLPINPALKTRETSARTTVP
jgi:MoaA/NifB/PqqE/SkfB family radical SAM enzyme